MGGGASITLCPRVDAILAAGLGANMVKWLFPGERDRKSKEKKFPLFSII